MHDLIWARVFVLRSADDCADVTSWLGQPNAYVDELGLPSANLAGRAELLSYTLIDTSHTTHREGAQHEAAPWAQSHSRNAQPV